MNQTQFNLTYLDDSDDIRWLKDLLRYEQMFLDFSYYSGFIIAAFNFQIFILAIIIYSQVGWYHFERKLYSVIFKEKL